jgi:primosomal protein N' (replication factor Y) (superfamily II helicase)
MIASGRYDPVMSQLFQEPESSAPAPAESGHVVGVAVAANVWGDFDYLWPDGWEDPLEGQRVRVPFGRGDRKTLGFVVDTLRRPSGRRLKAVAERIDETPQLDGPLRELGRWLSHYYLTPIGMTLGAMVPSAVGRHASRSETIVYLASAPEDWPNALGKRQRKLLDELHEARRQGVEPLPLESLLRRSGATRESVRRLVGRELIRMEQRPVRLPDLGQGKQGEPFALNEDQQGVLKAIDARIDKGGFSGILLHGVTGSGKTEVYVRAIQRVIDAGRQAILLVPEIALATQTIQRLLERLPRVAVLHSALTDTQRAFYYEQIRDGHASVVVGPRSAVFAPTRSLGLVIVDEEHEPSYKQDTAPRYHGRDVAVMRASLAKVPVILGSATPSLESLHNAQKGRYELLRLPRRVRGLPMPTLQIVNLRDEITPGRVELIGRTLTLRMAAALDRREQIILLMNRRGYASYVFCPKCKWEMTCEHCTRAMVFHQATRLAMCHYCQHTEALPEHCPACKGKLLLFGMGIQRIESELSRKFPEARLARMDSDTMTSVQQFQTVFDQFRDGELDLLLGTQMVAKGLDFPRVSLVGVISADTSLSIPDFRASERTFQLIVQVAGRAGRADLPGQVVVQTLHADEPAIQWASKHDYDSFAQAEMAQRREAGYPPQTRMTRFLIRHKDSLIAQDAAVQLADRLRRTLPEAGWTMYGPQPAGVAKLRDQFRFEIQLIASRAGLVQQTLAPRMGELSHGLKAEIIADVDPVNLL